jgi:hypothetical protein
VPQLIEGYATEKRMDARAAPYIVAWLVLGGILFWATRHDWPVSWNVASAAAACLSYAVAFTFVRLLRGRRPWPASPSVDVIDIGLMGLLVGVAAGVVHTAPLAGITAGLNALLGIGVIYVVIGFGLVEIGIWGVRRLAGEVLHIFGLLARTLPVLLILVLFLLFASEIWEAAHELTIVELGAVLGLICAVAVLLIVTALRAEMAMVEKEGSEALVARARDTPAEPLVGALAAGSLARTPLTWLQTLNLALLVVFSQLIQSFFVGILVTAFLVALGLLALPASLQERWVSDEVGTLAQFSLLSEIRTVSHELVVVSALLGGVVSLYFTGLAVTDPTYRAEHFSRVLAEVRQLLAARTLYIAALHGRVRPSLPVLGGS